MRDGGTTSAFQMPPRVSAARGAGTEPSPAARRHPPRRGRTCWPPRAGSPETSHGALAASTRTAARAQPHRGPGPQRRPAARRLWPRPALALSDPSGTSTAQGHGNRASTRQRRPRTSSQGSGVPDQHRPVPDDQPLDDERAPLVDRHRRQPSGQRRSYEQPRDAEAAAHQARQEHELLQQLPGSELVEHRDHGVRRHRPRQAEATPRKSGRRARSGTQTMS